MDTKHDTKHCERRLTPDQARHILEITEWARAFSMDFFSKYGGPAWIEKSGAFIMGATSCYYREMTGEYSLNSSNELIQIMDLEMKRKGAIN